MFQLPLKILGEGIELVSLNEDHLNDFTQYATDKSFYNYLEYDAPKSNKEARELFDKFLERNNRINSFYYAILESNISKCIGTIGIFNFSKDELECEISYGLSVNYHGRGIAHEAIIAVCNLLFNKTITQINAITPINNIPSLHFLDRLLFERKKTINDLYLINNIKVDGVHYCLSKNIFNLKNKRVEKKIKNISFNLLSQLGLTSKETQEIYNIGVRDNKDTIVYRDKVSGVIYHNDYIGNRHYQDTTHQIYSETSKSIILSDNKRRLNDFKDYYIKKNILDFGCGDGKFIKDVKDLPLSRQAVDFSIDCVKHLKDNNINSYTDLNDIENNSLDTIFLFHVLEHLPNPVQILNSLKEKIIDNGKIIIEVPNANDFLLSKLKNEKFKQNTLWSEHLILHTKESLKKILTYCKFKNIKVCGVQRYGVFNHLNWLLNESSKLNEDFYHSSPSALIKEYERTLDMIDSTDTLVAIASK